MDKLNPAEKRKIGRLAFREESGMWNAYYAMPHTMVGAILLGSIRMKLVAKTERRNAFLALMREAFSDEIFELFGVRPDLKEEKAPEHEREKNAGHS